MEVIKTLPAVFEEFSEQRRNSFLHASDCAPSRMKPSQKQSRTCPETSAHW